eukprot:1134250-Pelagomonas_calceolata.AAC.8
MAYQAAARSGSRSGKHHQAQARKGVAHHPRGLAAPAAASAPEAAGCRWGKHPHPGPAAMRSARLDVEL